MNRLLYTGLAALGYSCLGQAQTTFDLQRRENVPIPADRAVSVAALDVDGDGDDDLLFGREAGVVLMLNDGASRFVDRTETRLPPTANLVRYPRDFALGDVNGDGYPDLAIAVSGTHASPAPDELWLGSASGAFSLAPAGMLPSMAVSSDQVFLGDTDGDGDLDLLFSGANSAGRYLENQGNGSFLPVTRPSVPAIQGVAALVDFDGDGDLDLYNLSLIWLGSYGIFWNDGAGNFTPGPVLNATASGPAQFGDFDADGRMDYAFQYDTNIYVSWNDPAGLKRRLVFANPYSRVNVDQVVAVRAVDVDGDGMLDLVLGERTHRGNVLLNQGGRVFAPRGQDLLPRFVSHATDLAVGDFDSDGAPDIAIASRRWQTSEKEYDHVLLNRIHVAGVNTFVHAGLTQVPLESWIETEWFEGAAGDMDGDGNQDILIAPIDDGSTSPGYPLLGDGKGAFTPVRLGPQRPTAEWFPSVSLVDVDGDGDLDAHYGRADENVNPPLTNQDRLFLNDGTGQYHEVTSTHLSPASEYATRDVAFGDLDGDGDLDFMAAHALRLAGIVNFVYMNLGQGVFRNETSIRMPLIAHRSYAVALGDIDGDSDLDAVFGNGGNANPEPEEIYLNDGRGAFTEVGGVRLSQHLTATWSVDLKDVDGDGDLDLLRGTEMGILLDLNDGSGFFTPSVFPSYSRSVRELHAFDFDLDGDLEVVAVTRGAGLNEDAWIIVYENDGRGTFTDVTSTSIPANFVLPWSTILITDADTDGDQDIFTARGILFNQTRQMVDPYLTFVAGIAPLRIRANPGLTAIPFVGFSESAFPGPSGSFFRIDPSTMIALPPLGIPASGELGIDIPIAAEPALAGFRALFQTVLLDGSTMRFNLTNLLEVRIY